MLADDARFVDVGARTRHIGELLEIAGGHVARGTTAHWLATCERLEIPAAPVSRLDDLPADPHLVATGFFVWAKTPMSATASSLAAVADDPRVDVVDRPDVVVMRPARTAALDQGLVFVAGARVDPQAYEQVLAGLGPLSLTAVEAMGGIDALKLRSSMTLFEAAARRLDTVTGAGMGGDLGAGERSGFQAAAWSVFADVLDRYFGGERDRETLRRL